MDTAAEGVREKGLKPGVRTRNRTSQFRTSSSRQTAEIRANSSRFPPTSLVVVAPFLMKPPSSTKLCWSTSVNFREAFGAHR
jgi:hypothetical protein